jgi:recombination protein RecA
MSAAISKIDIESRIAARFGDAFKIHEKPPVEALSTGVSEVDLLTGGLPRGALSEVFGPTSSGRTSLVLSMLAYATTHAEICALVDVSDVFSPNVAVSGGIDPDRLLWIRCADNLEHAFKATDLLLHAGGFGLIVLDMGDVPGKEARRIITSWWYRFRRTVENKPTAIVVVSAEACTRSCASLTLELNGIAGWIKNSSNSKLTPRQISSKEFISHTNLLQANTIKVNQRRPITPGVNEGYFSSSSVF